jgi:hypothetical protein
VLQKGTYSEEVAGERLECHGWKSRFFLSDEVFIVPMTACGALRSFNIDLAMISYRLTLVQLGKRSARKTPVPLRGDSE